MQFNVEGFRLIILIIIFAFIYRLYIETALSGLHRNIINPGCMDTVLQTIHSRIIKYIDNDTFIYK